MSKASLSRKVKAQNPYDLYQSLLDSDLDFHNHNSLYATHSFHSFPAKFPPQLPAFFIENLTEPGDTVLDPMAGSGTTLVEAITRNRSAIGIDLDPLAVELCRVKTTPIKDAYSLNTVIDQITARALKFSKSDQIEKDLSKFFDPKTREFINYWFLPQTQKEIFALIQAINQYRSFGSAEREKAVKRFLLISLSSIIITKSAGVSLARDLAHSRPHRDLTKKIPDAIIKFRERARKNISGLLGHHLDSRLAKIYQADCRDLSKIIPDYSIDLIITSPPYANAIDYMRAHKFFLVWLGYSVSELGQLRSTYLGSEKIGAPGDHQFPETTSKIISRLEQADKNKAQILRKYYYEMGLVLKEMARVLKPNASAIMVAGSSVMRGIDIQVPQCLSEIATQPEIGLKLIGIKIRTLDRNKRMLPMRFGNNNQSQIEQRMNEEFIIFLCRE